MAEQLHGGSIADVLAVLVAVRDQQLVEQVGIGDEIGHVAFHQRHASDAAVANGDAAPEAHRIAQQRVQAAEIGPAARPRRLTDDGRCLSCGNCFSCDNCFGVCPDNAVIKLGPGGPGQYEIDYDYCKGCGICANECPSKSIKMVRE